MKSYLTEFIGTFFLVLTIGLAGGLPDGALAIGGVLMVMVFMGGHISGAHYNPAVSLAVLIRGKMAAKDLIPYWVAQIAAAVAAALLVRYLFVGTAQFTADIPAGKLMVALLNEFLFTFGLALVVLNVATAKGTSGNSFYGLAIGFTVVAAAIAGVRFSKGAYNPAVGIGLILIGVPMKLIWLYLVGPLAGGAVAAVVFKVQNPEG